MAVDFTRSEYEKNLPKWKLVDDITSGDNVKNYLIKLNPNDESDENVIRNRQYKDRAIFYKIAGQTLAGLNGLLYRKDPEIELPAGLEYLKKNADGGGVSIYQQSQQSSKECIKKGRFGLYVTFPQTEGRFTKRDRDSGRYISTIHQIDAQQIINWQVATVGSKVVLTKVVIKEVAQVQGEDEFETKEQDQFKELSLDDGIFVVRDWVKIDGEWNFTQYTPTDARGSNWDVIPFVFGGSTANTQHVDEIPMLGLCEVNKGHFRNSADYEDSVFFTGQAQAWMSGLNQNHVDQMKEANVYVGSRNLLAVPSGENFGFESAEPNTMVRQAMIDKVDMMIGLGARFIQQGGAAKTATEANNEAQTQHSVLSLIALNVSDAYEQAIQFCARYMGETITESNMKFRINQDFVDNKATAQDIQAMVAGFIQGAIPASDYFNWMKKVEIVDNEKTLEQFNEEVSQSQMPNMDA